MEQILGMCITYLLGKENQVADVTSRLTKDDLTSVKSLLQAYPLLASYRRCQLPPELSLRLINFLTDFSEVLPGPLMLRGHFTPA